MPRFIKPLLIIIGIVLLAVSVRGQQQVTVAYDRAECNYTMTCPDIYPSHSYFYRDLIYVGKYPVGFEPLAGEVLQWIFQTTAAVHHFGVSFVNENFLTPEGKMLESEIVQVQWCADGSCDVAPPPVVITGYKGEYFNNLTLTGTPALVRDYQTISFNWGYNAPDPSIQADRFSVRWTRTIDFEDGTYRFTTLSDDGVRLWIGDVLLIDRWNDHATTIDVADAEIIAGPHAFKLEFYENCCYAQIEFSFAKVAAPPPPAEEPPPPPPPTAPTCTLGGLVYQVGDRTSERVRRSQVSSWLSSHPEWRYISQQDQNRTWTVITVECVGV